MFVSIGMFETTLHFKPPQATYAKERKLSRVSKNLSPFHVHSVFRLPANSVHGILV